MTALQISLAAALTLASAASWADCTNLGTTPVVQSWFGADRGSTSPCFTFTATAGAYQITALNSDWVTFGPPGSGLAEYAAWVRGLELIDSLGTHVPADRVTELTGLAAPWGTPFSYVLGNRWTYGALNGGAYSIRLAVEGASTPSLAQTYSLEIAAVPEPATAALLACGLVSLLVLRRQRLG